MQVADKDGKTPVEEATRVGKLRDTMVALANGTLDIDDIV